LVRSALVGRFMATPRFDPTGSVTFNLRRGRVEVSGTAERVLVPADALAALLTSAGSESARDFGRQLGTEIGRRVAERLSATSDAGVEAVVEHLGGDLALMGLGSLAAERWGRALVLIFSDSPFGAQGDELLAAVVEGAIQRAFGRDVSVVRLSREDRDARFLVTGPDGADRMRRLLASGLAWGEALTRLQTGGAS
jgi:hypothetical protein